MWYALVMLFFILYKLLQNVFFKDAENIYMKEDIVKRLAEATTSSERKECKEVLIFYCEFSSERGPSM